MCRIAVGVAKDTFRYETTFLADCLLDACLDMSARANRDGAGVLLTNAGSQDYTPVVYKKAKPLSDVVNTYDFVSWLHGENSGLGPVICHVRQATTGKGNVNNDAFAHPFQLNNLYLVHNGHLLNAEKVRDRLELPKELEVDSEIFLHALSKNADSKPLTLEIIQQTVDLFIGPFVFVVYEANEDFVWLILGKGRTLHHYDSQDYSVILTESGYSSLLTREFNRYYFLDGVEFNHFEFAAKLPQDTVFQLSGRGLVRIGEIISVEDYPKVTSYFPVKNVARDRVAGTVNTGINVTEPTVISDYIEISDIRLIVAELKEFMNKFNLSEIAIYDLLYSLYPLFPIDMYSLSDTQITLLKGFLQSLAYVPSEYPAKVSLWDKIKNLMGKSEEFINDPESSFYKQATKVKASFLQPFYLNSIQSLAEVFESLNSKEPKG